MVRKETKADPGSACPAEAVWHAGGLQTRRACGTVLCAAAQGWVRWGVGCGVGGAG